MVESVPQRPRRGSPPRPFGRDAPPPPEVLGLDYYSNLSNFEEFCRDCLVIVTKQGNRVPFVLNSSQRIVLNTVRRLIAAGVPPRIVVLKARQVGISTLVEALLFWDCLVRSNRSSLVVAHTLKSSRVLFRMTRNFHRFLKGPIEQKTRVQNIHEIEFDSGSRLQVEVQGDPRGYTAQRIHCSEFGFFEQPEDTLIALMQTVPLTLDSLVVIESTANGFGNKFHKLWQRAVGLSLDPEIPEDEKGWTPVFIPWFQHEEYELPCPEKFFQFTSVEQGLIREHPKITRQKVKWRRWSISANLDGDEEKFAQEYPATDLEAFSLSGRPAFDLEAVSHYTKALNELVLAGKLPHTAEIDAEPAGIGVPVVTAHDRGRLRIFRPPQDRHTYVVGGDPSEGDPGSDPSPLAVLNDQTMDVDATWYGKTPPDLLALRAIDMAHYYNDALIINEANNHGILFQDTVLQIGYPNLYYRLVSEESVAGRISEKPGYLATSRNRDNLFNTLRKYVRMRMGKIECPHLVQQIQTLIYVDDKVQAGPGSEKDLLVCVGLCLMAHRGSMSNPLEPFPENVVRSIASLASILKEREGPEAADQFTMVETGMTCEEMLKMQDAIIAREANQRKYGLGGLR